LGKSKIKGREYSQSMSPNSLAFDLAVAVDFTQHEQGIMRETSVRGTGLLAWGL